MLHCFVSGIKMVGRMEEAYQPGEGERGSYEVVVVMVVGDGKERW